MNIVHISDLHLCNRHKQKNIKKTEHLLQIMKNRGIDHLIISGDISQNSNQEDFIIFRDMLIQYDFYDSAKATIIPGNHDIFGGVHLASDIITFPQKCRETDYDQKIQYFYEIYKDLFQETIQPNPSSPFPFAKIFGNLVIFGLDTNMKYSYWGNPLASNGTVGPVQIKHLEALLATSSFKNKIKIIVSHHHYYNYSNGDEYMGFYLWQMIEQMTMQLHKRKRLIRMYVKNDVKLVLHGHTHANYIFEKKGITFANGGGVLESDYKNGEGRINVIKINENQPEVSMETIQLIEPVRDKFLLYRDLKPGFVA